MINHLRVMANVIQNKVFQVNEISTRHVMDESE